jgi:iron(III) transport system ATP-binding protein
MAQVGLHGLTKKFGDFVAVNNFEVTVKDGEFLTLLGPSGCGKTTTLRMIAGFLTTTNGKITIGERVVSDPESGLFVQPEDRNIGMVFQSYAVWPHMTVIDNVAYPLKIKKISKSQRYERALQVLKQVRLDGLQDRYPHELSGGQQQRVALARALIMDPQVMLLDEPLSNLDAKLRAEMRFEIKDLQRRTRITIVYVTHDQAESMAMSDRIVVMNHGSIQQIGTPEDVYERPANTFVAEFIGLTNFIPCRVSEDRRALVMLEVPNHRRFEHDIPGRVSGDVMLSIRPEDVYISKPRADEDLRGKVRRATFLGNIMDYRVSVGNTVIRVEAKDAEFSQGEEVSLRFDRDKITMF